MFPSLVGTNIRERNLAPMVLTVDLGAIAANYRYLAELTGVAVAGVVKANAYGLGLAEVARTLYACGCRHFFVATPEEGLALRDIDEESQIMVLGGLYRGAEEFYAGRGLIPVLCSDDEVRRWSQAATRFGSKLPAVLQFDTGMNRLGLKHDERPDVSALDVRLVLSHFAKSDEKDDPMTERQAKTFAKIAADYPAAKSLCNSSGIFRKAAWHYDLVRPGYALYGGNPVPEAENPMRSVVSLQARILQVHEVKRGQTAGYGAAYEFGRDTKVAVVAAGYADGFLRSGSSRTNLYCGSTPCPVAGRVSMDLVICDIGLVERRLEAGDWLDILGPYQSIDRLADGLRTIGYEVLTSLSSRALRVYS